MVVILGTPACDLDRSPRQTAPPEGREVDEPFADLYVVAGREPGIARLYAFDLLNLELEPLAERSDVLRIRAVCDGRPLVEIRSPPGLEAPQLMVLGDGELQLSGEDPLAGDCILPAADGGKLRVGAWTLLAVSPNGKRGVFTKGREVAVGPSPDFRPLEHVGTARLPIWSAVWVRR